MPFPPYLHGPPVTSHTIADTWYLRYGAGDRLRPALISGFRFRVLFVTSRSMKSSTTAVIPFSPPSRSYSGVDGSFPEPADCASALLAAAAAAMQAAAMR